MPISTENFTLSTSEATQIVGPDNMIQRVSIHNNSKEALHYIYVGNSGVTSSNGLHVDPGETLQLEIRPQDDLWAVSAFSSTSVGVLVVTKRD